VAASEDRARRRQQRRAGGANEPRAHERGRTEEEPRAPRADAAPAPVTEKQGGGFIHQSIGELKKVEWPGQTQVVQATTVVLIACIIVGIWLYANDFIWQRVVKNILLS
jgi:preprotein translocase SecE subunit